MLEKHSDMVSFQLEKAQVEVNGKKEEITSPMALIDGEYYVAADIVAEKLKFNYNWDISKNQAVAVNTAEESSILPLKYDLRDKKRAPGVLYAGPLPPFPLWNQPCSRRKPGNFPRTI